jgi:hypothetical protein
MTTITLARKLQTCIDELISIQFDPCYRQDWEDMQTNLGHILVSLQILLDTIKETENHDN